MTTRPMRRTLTVACTAALAAVLLGACDTAPAPPPPNQYQNDGFDRSDTGDDERSEPGS